uniref:Uncharacterized protein n=1 Tax=Anguilla anguilla TaxID=7936 RepID=A0A0E9RH13_ANGAN
MHPPNGIIPLPQIKTLIVSLPLNDEKRNWHF